MYLLVNLVSNAMTNAENWFRDGKDYDYVYEKLFEYLRGEFDDETLEVLVNRIIKDAESRI